MIIRSIQESDLAQIEKIHEKFYKTEFDLPDFIRHYLCAFVVTDDEQIISVGGVRTLLESVVITNKQYSPRVRRAALYQMLEASAYITKHHGYQELHAFVQDDVWSKQLKKVGFRNTKGEALVIGVD